VEVMGSPAVFDPAFATEIHDLHDAHLRVIERGKEVKAQEATLESVAEDQHDSDLIQVRGRLLALQQLPTERGEWRTSMVLGSDGLRLPVGFQDRSKTDFSTLRVDDEVLVQGVVLRATAANPRRLMMLAAGDARSLGLSPAVRARQFYSWGGGVLAALALLSGWVVALRRRNRSQVEVSHVLEQQVSARTTELEKAKAELHRALEQERELGELKSRFVTTVSHEFRTPLGIIMSAVELLRHHEEKLPTEQKGELYEDIHSSTKLMASLMEQVLVLGRVEAGKLGCRRAVIDLPILLGKLVDELHSATSRRCEVKLSIDGDLSGAEADESLVRHIATNLIANAVKYSPDGQSVQVIARREGAQLELLIIDKGIGIADEDQHRLFEAFHRGKNVGDIPGTGLGLLIVKRCIELHDGTIEVRSEIGKGSQFTVRLPVF
jgi:signal transduction histidine kinase